MEIILSIAIPYVALISVLYLVHEREKYYKNNYVEKQKEEPLPKLMTQEEINEIDDTINLDQFMKTVYKIYKDYEQAKQHFDYDKLELLLGHDLKMIQLEKLHEYERLNRQIIYKNFSACGGGIYHIYKYGPIEKIDILLNVRRTAYLINRSSKFCIEGDRDTIKRVTYHITLERTMNGYPSNCPSCGASLDIDDNSKCTYCGSFISNTLGDYKMIFKEELRIADDPRMHYDLDATDM